MLEKNRRDREVGIVVEETPGRYLAILRRDSFCVQVKKPNRQVTSILTVDERVPKSQGSRRGSY